MFWTFALNFLHQDFVFKLLFCESPGSVSFILNETFS